MIFIKKYHFVIFFIFLILTYLFLPKSLYEYLKINKTIKSGENIVLFEKNFFSLGNNKEFILTSRSYTQESGIGIIAIELNGEIIDSGDTLVNSSQNIQSQTIFRIRDSKFGKNKLRIISWIDNGDKFIISSLGIKIN